jgi:hypothetical protein
MKYFPSCPPKNFSLKLSKEFFLPQKSFQDHSKSCKNTYTDKAELTVTSFQFLNGVKTDKVPNLLDHLLELQDM